MKTVESFFAELADRRSSLPVASILPSNFQGISIELPGAIRQALSRHWRVFTVDVTSKFASEAAVTAHLAEASCDTQRLQAAYTDNPECNFAVVTGPGPDADGGGIFVLEVEAGCAGLAARIRAAITGVESDDFGWRTLASQAGGSLFAFFNYPAGRVSRARKQLAPGLTLHGTGGWVLIPPSVYSASTAHVYLDPDQPVLDAPEWIIELAFGAPSGGSVPPVPRFPPQSVTPAYRRIKDKPGSAAWRPDVNRNGYPSFRIGVNRGKFHSAPRN
jgi:hypothetical protein